MATGALIGGSVLAAACGSESQSASGSTPTSQRPGTPDQALEALKAGNARFVKGQPLNQGRDSVRRAELAESQAPFAVILGCSDSRVVPEVLFDQGLGDLFLVRVAGNTGTDPILLGSIEYGVGVIGAPLLVVLGHQGCGAVKAALANVTQGETVPGAIPAVLQPILPAARAVLDQPSSEQLDAAVRQNVQMQVTTLPGTSSVLQPAVSGGRLKVVGAEYELENGRVRFL